MNQLSPLGELLLDEYREYRPQLELLAEKVYNMLTTTFREQGIQLNAIEYRVKAEESLVGKIVRKGDKYKSLDSITDLVGLRIITFYSDDVDKVAAIVQQLFEIDWDNSVDKRKLHDPNSFGYSSLHYICRLKTGGIRFEIQMRTALQHVWSAIEHDIGYKGFVTLPPEYRRQFSRLAGMLELADDEFSRLRTTMTDYRRQIQALVKSGRLDEVPLSNDSFDSYLKTHPFDRLNKRIAAVNQAEIFPAAMTSFLPVLIHFNFETLGDIERFINENFDNAYQLALAQLAVTDIDILSESVGLQNLCLAYALKKGGDEKELHFIFDTINGHQDANDFLIENIKKLAENIALS